MDIAERIRDSKIIAEMMEDCSLPKRIYIMELCDCSEKFRDEKEYSLHNSQWKVTEFRWERVESGIYAIKSFFRPVAVQDLMEQMMRQKSFEGSLRLWHMTPPSGERFIF